MKLNQSGNTLVMVLVASTLILGAVVISIQYVGITNRTSINELKNSLAGNDDLIALNILAGKLFINKKGTEWGVEPYPTAQELLPTSNFKPYIKSFSTATSSLVPNIRVGGEKDLSAPGGCSPLPEPRDRVNSVSLENECNLTNFDLDASKLGSLERGVDLSGWSDDLSRRRQTELQKGFVGYPKLSQLSSSELNDFFEKQNGAFPTSGINAKSVTFYNMAVNPEEPRILSQLEVEIGKIRAVIPINAPPEPTCKLTTTISPRVIDCHEEPTVTYTHGIVGHHNEIRQSSSIRTIPTSTPRTSLAVSRCSNNPGTSYPPLYPSVNNCAGYVHNYRTITFYSTTYPIFRVSLAAQSDFSERGLIYAIDSDDEILKGGYEINERSKISFEQLLSELGVSSSVIENKEETVVTQSSIRVDDYGNIPVFGTKTVCNPRETPECKDDCIELSSGRRVTANLYADSLLGMAQISGNSFQTFENFPTDARQSIKTIRDFTSQFPNETPIREAWGSKLVPPPANLYLVQGPRLWTNEDGSIDDEHGVWTVSGKITGLKRASPTTTCDTNLKVFPPPPPACIASIANPNILQGETTEVTLNCQGPSSGRVTSAQILNQAAFDVSSFSPSQRGASNYKIAKVSYVRKGAYLSETINIKVIGPGAPNGIVVTALLGQVCHHNDPNALSYISRGGFASAPLRRAPYWNGRWITFATSWDHGWNGGNADCSVNFFCMTSIEASTQKRRGSWFPYPGLYANDGGYYVAQIGPKRSPHCYITNYALRRRGCFTGETRIKMADGQEKLVSKISENDLIWNPLYQSPVKVIKVVKGPEKKALYQLRVAKNRLTVTEDHPFLTQRGWVRADQLSRQDLIMGEGLGKEILSIKKLSYKKPIDVYNFELETDIPEGHIVIANGIPTGDLTTQIEIKQNDKKLP